MPWYNPNPQPDAPITSAWGNAIENACYPVFATLAALNSGWADAPDGAHAFVLDSRRDYYRRGGQWLLPLQSPRGLVVNQFPGPYGTFTPVVGPPGYTTAGFGPFTLTGKRMYLVTMQHRIQLNAAVANVSLGTHLNFAGTLNDVALTWNGGAPEFANGQIIMENAFPLPWNGAVVQGSWAGICKTGGNDDQPLGVRAQVVLNNTTAAVILSAMTVTCVDIGPAS